MVVMKFGGTSVADVAAFRRLVEIVRSRRLGRSVSPPTLRWGISNSVDTI